MYIWVCGTTSPPGWFEDIDLSTFALHAVIITLNREGRGTNTNDDTTIRGIYQLQRLFTAREYRADVFEP